MKPRFDLLTLQLLLAVESTGSVARAADSMHLTASAVSKRILELEERLGLALLERHPTGARLSLAGAALAKRSAAVLRELHGLQDDMAEFVSGTAGSIRLASNTSGLACGLSDQLARFKRLYPDIEISVRETTSQAVVQAVAEGWADFGIASATADLGTLSADPYCSTPLVLAVPSGHALAGAGAVSYADTLAYPHIGRAPDSALTRLPIPPSCRPQTMALDTLVTSFSAVFSLVRAGVGVAVVPLGPARVSVPDGIELLALTDDWAHFPLSLVRDPGALLTPAASRLLVVLRQR